MWHVGLPRSAIGLGSVLLLLSGCVSLPPAPHALPTWPERMQQLQTLAQWDLQGRAAAAVATQGWQASLAWRQQPQGAQIHLAGPLGVGAMSLQLGAQGMQILDSRAPSPSPADTAAWLDQRLGFAPPFARLRYWLLGVPSPDLPFEWQGNAQDRAQSIVQDGWRVEYPDYMPVGADVLPRRVIIMRDAVRVRVAVERWTLGP